MYRKASRHHARLLGCSVWLSSSSSSLALFFCTIDLRLLAFIDRQAPKLLLRSPLAILTTSVPDTRSYSALGVGLHGDPGLLGGFFVWVGGGFVYGVLWEPGRVQVARSSVWRQ
jgi:hypothetical protein